MSRIILPKNNGMDYVIIGTHANIDIDIWIKFVSYFKKSELEFLEDMKNKDIDDMEVSELERYTELSRQNKVANLFKKYKEKNCTKEEHDAVKKFMEQNDLENFVNSRMTDEEIGDARSFINDLTKDQLQEYINVTNLNYENLSVYDAYVLFIAKERLYAIETMDFVEDTMRKEAENAQHLHMSLLRDFGPHFKMK